MAKKKTGVTIQQALDYKFKEYDANTQMLDENVKENKRRMGRIVDWLEREHNISRNSDLSAVNDVKALEKIVEKQNKTKSGIKEKKTYGHALKTLVNAAKNARLDLEITNNVESFEKARGKDPVKSFNTKGLRTMANVRYPAPWEFHKAINEGFAAIDNKDIKTFAMVKLFTGIRNPDILRLEILPEDPDLRVDEKNYYDPKYKKVRVYNKGKFVDLDLGMTANAILQEQAEIAEDLGRTHLFPQDIPEKTFRDVVNDNVRQSLKASDLEIIDKNTNKQKLFSIKDLRSNLYDIIEEEYGKDIANDLLGHKGDFHMGMHDKAERTARRAQLGKLKAVDVFSKLFLEDILFSTDENGVVSIPENKGLSPKNFLKQHGYERAAKTLKNISLTEKTPVTLVSQAASEVVAMTSAQVTEQVNSFKRVMKTFGEAVAGELKSLRRQITEATKLGQQVADLKKGKAQQTRETIAQKIADLKAKGNIDLNDPNFLNASKGIGKKTLTAAMLAKGLTFLTPPPVKAAEVALELGTEVMLPKPAGSDPDSGDPLTQIQEALEGRSVEELETPGSTEKRIDEMQEGTGERERRDILLERMQENIGDPRSKLFKSEEMQPFPASRRKDIPEGVTTEFLEKAKTALPKRQDKFKTFSEEYQGFIPQTN